VLDYLPQHAVETSHLCAHSPDQTGDDNLRRYDCLRCRRLMILTAMNRLM
jgi:hypothetical protein